MHWASAIIVLLLASSHLVVESSGGINFLTADDVPVVYRTSDASEEYHDDYTQDMSSSAVDDEPSVPGEPDKDYPVLAHIPKTSFKCEDVPYLGYYADVEARCQVFHICTKDKIKFDYLCPNGTIFHQEQLTCVPWKDYECKTAPLLYKVDQGIYKNSMTDNLRMPLLGK